MMPDFLRACKRFYESGFRAASREGGKGEASNIWIAKGGINSKGLLSDESLGGPSSSSTSATTSDEQRLNEALVAGVLDACGYLVQKGILNGAIIM
eukprot:8781903-Alexandrium_andersonii.AAC.1